MAEKAKFPKRFLWGASMAAHQVEGNTKNQWTAWERENAKVLAAKATYRFGKLASWSDIEATAKDPSNYISGKAVEHYERYVEDIAAARKLNINALRFSVEWSRIEPDEGVWDAEAIAHYKKYVSELTRSGIEPVLTLFHFTLPVWFAELGGFEKRGNIKYFTRFAEKILHEIGSDITYVITINEPEVYAVESYYLGNWPPARESKLMTARIFNNLISAHNRTSKLIHGMSRRYKVSIAKNSNYFYAGDDAKLSILSADISQFFQDDYILKRVRKQCDFLGVNYYFSNRVYGYRIHNPNQKVNDLGWDMSPGDLEFVLERLYKKYKLPIIVTENGCADASDANRQWWLSQTIGAMQRAIANGIDLRGYLHWSLLDNFEWDKGKWPRFGLIEVDYGTMERTVRLSAQRYAAFIKKVRG